MLGKISADDILKYFSYFFPQKIGFDISCKLSPKQKICKKSLSLFSGENKNNMINLSFAELAQKGVKVNAYIGIDLVMIIPSASLSISEHGYPR